MRQTALLITGIALLAACSGDPTAASTAAELQSRAAAAGAAAAGGASFGAAVNKDLATLRRATAPFHNFATASDAGWSTKITSCMTDPDGAGGMGFHYGNTDLIDGTASVDKPELLLYEPDKNGRLTLVAVEYIIPYTAHARKHLPCSSVSSSSRMTCFSSGDCTHGCGSTTRVACSPTGIQR